MVDISLKQRRIAKLKAEGKKNKEIAAIEYPHAKQRSGEVLVSRELKKPHVAKYHTKELNDLLMEHGVTKNQYIMNIGEAMKAEKQNQFTGEITPDLGTRLQGNKMAERFLKFEDSPTDLIGDLTGMDEVELNQAIFRKSSQ